ncbi:MAG: MobA/MobL family protein [Sideroxydans sp.]|jgi:hypothetical protein
MHIAVGTRQKGGAQFHGRYIRRDEDIKVEEEHPFDVLQFNRPAWAIDMDDFWNAVDTLERKNGSVYREFEVGLPPELSQFTNIELVTKWVAKKFPNQVVEVGVHWKEGNPHAHIQVCERLMDGIARERDQFFKRYNPSNPKAGGCKKDDRFTGNWIEKIVGESKKEHAWRRRKASVEAILSVRESWAVEVNHLIVPLGLEPISPLSNRARGINKPPAKHIGRKALAMAKRGIIGDRISDVIEMEERSAYVISSEANQTSQPESDQGSDQAVIDRTVQRTKQVPENRPEQNGREIGGVYSHIREESNQENCRFGETNQGRKQKEHRFLGKMDIGDNWIWIPATNDLSGCRSVVKIHTPGFKAPAYFSTVDLSRKPIAIGLDGGGFTLVKDATPSDEQLAELILDAAGPEREHLELFGNAEWLMRASKMCERLGLEYEYLESNLMQSEVNAHSDQSESTRSPGV